jgi:hypothetical protein
LGSVADLGAVRSIGSWNCNVPTCRKRREFNIRAAPGVHAGKLDVSHIEDPKDKRVVVGVALILRLCPALAIKIPIGMYSVRVPREQDNTIIIVGCGKNIRFRYRSRRLDA